MYNQENLNENFINELLQKLEQDRNKFFNEIKNSKSSTDIKDVRLKQIEQIQRSLISYKKTILKNNDKDI